MKRYWFNVLRIGLLALFVGWLLIPRTTEVAGASPSVLACDFDADGFDDLPIGVPGEDGSGGADQGAVNVLSGSPLGPTAAGDADTFFTQASAGILGAAEAGDRFGSSLACGDFDGDGFDDLAIGVPGEDVGTKIDAGAVNIIYGSGDGLASADNQLFTQSTSLVKGIAVAFDQFGAALAAGDFDDDGYDDLAIGVPGEDAAVGVNPEDRRAVGGVNVLYGSAAGMTTRDDLWTQASPGIAGAAEFGDAFGAALAVGDFDADGVDDLAIGAPLETIGDNTARAGTLHVIPGSGTGLTATGSRAYSQQSSGIQGVSVRGGQFARSLAAGDFDGDGFDDLAAGSPGSPVGAKIAAGRIHVLFGSAGGISSRDAVYDQDTADVRGVANERELFGWSLAAADFDDDGFDDLAVGTPFDVIGGVEGGSVSAFYGTDGGLGVADDQIFSQDTSNIRGVTEAFDSLGESLRVGDYDGDDRADLVVGAPGEDVGTKIDAGAVNVIFGGSSALTTIGNLSVSQDAGGVKGVAEATDQLGFADKVARDLDPDEFAPTLEWNDLQALRTTSTNSVVFGIDRWVFNKGTFSLSCALDVDASVDRVDRIRRVIEQSGREFVFTVPPDKPLVYPEHLGLLERRTDCLTSQHAVLLAALPPVLGSSYVDSSTPTFAFKAAHDASDPIYYPNDTHWTTESAMMLTELIVDHVQAGTFVTGDVVTGPVDHVGDLTKTMDFDYPYPVDWRSVERTGVTVERVDSNDHFGPGIWTASGAGPLIDKRILAVHDSFVREAREYISNYFADSTFLDWRIFFEGRGLDLPVDWLGPEMEKADVIFLQVTERFVDRRFDHDGDTVLEAAVGGLWGDLTTSDRDLTTAFGSRWELDVNEAIVPTAPDPIVQIGAPGRPAGFTTFAIVEVDASEATTLSIELLGTVDDPNPMVTWDVEPGRRAFALELPGTVSIMVIRPGTATIPSMATFRLPD